MALETFRLGEPGRLLDATRPPAGPAARRGEAGAAIWPATGAPRGGRWTAGEPWRAAGGVATTALDWFRDDEAGPRLLGAPPARAVAAELALTDRPRGAAGLSDGEAA